MNRGMRKRSGAFLIVLSALVGIAQVASADYSEVLADVNAKKEACRASQVATRSEKARNCSIVCRRAADRIARAKDANTVEKLKVGCDERYEAVGFGTADAPVAVPQAMGASMPDVIGVVDGRGVILAPDRQDWTTICGSRAQIIRPKRNKGLVEGSRVRVVGILQDTAKKARFRCRAQEIVPL